MGAFCVRVGRLSFLSFANFRRPLAADFALRFAAASAAPRASLIARFADFGADKSRIPKSVMIAARSAASAR
jgi:hypothetical protein